MNLEELRPNSCIELPKSVVELHNLSILDISECLSLTKLPEEIGELRNLRKFYMIDCSSCELPYSVVKLVHLKEVIGDEETVNSWKTFSSFLPNLTISAHKDINLDWLR